MTVPVSAHTCQRRFGGQNGRMCGAPAKVMLGAECMLCHNRSDITLCEADYNEFVLLLKTTPWYCFECRDKVMLKVSEPINL